MYVLIDIFTIQTYSSSVILTRFSEGLSHRRLYNKSVPMPGPSFLPEGFIPRAGGRIELTLGYIDPTAITEGHTGLRTVTVTGVIVQYISTRSMAVDLAEHEAQKIDPKTSVLSGCTLRYTGRHWILIITLSVAACSVSTIRELQEHVPCHPIQEPF